MIVFAVIHNFGKLVDAKAGLLEGYVSTSINCLYLSFLRQNRHA